ncbi:MAG: zeta toxin family protein [Gammaproteobacteria bacterium]|nr:zeta toxin family protein [Gammaproteobacteria bacterium]
MQGKIIFLNGTSSAGKTTLAHALQELLNEPWLHIALDQFRDGLPAKYRGLNSPHGSTGEAGLNVVPVTDVEKPFTAIRFGEVGTKMLLGMRRAIRAFAESGNNIIIDDIILESEFLQDYLDVLDGLEVIFVGVRCPMEVINKREEARPGRFPGTALGHFEICHAHDDYDVNVDTASNSPQQCAAKVIDFLASGKPGAFNRIRLN